jgi:hypothetical protein
MKKTLLAVIIAATALVPPAALAQDRGRWGGRDRSANNSGQSEVRQNRGEWRQQQREQAPQAQPQRQWNGGGERQRGWNRPQQQAQPQQAPQAVQQQRERWGGDRGDRSRWNNSGDRSRWTGDRSQWNGGTRRPDADRQQQFDQQRQQQFRDGDRSRWNDRNRDGDRSGWNDGNRDRSRYDRGNRDWNDRDRTRNWNGDRNRYDSNRGWNNDRNRGSWNNRWRNDRRYDWRGYRGSNRNIYRLPRYYAPSGWGYGYRRFGIGFTLNSILFSSNYWINDPFYYRLPEVDGPYRWVRYYNDALLVDIYSGEVVDVIYDIFW